MLTAVLKAVKMLLSCCPKYSQDAVVLTALKAVQDAEKNHPHKYQVQRLIPIRLHLCDMGLAASWLSTLLGPMVKLATVMAGVVSCRLLVAGGASAGATLDTSSRPGLGASARLVPLAALATARRGRGLPLLITLAGLLLFPSEM
jgi:hypothetical protein